MWLEDRIFRDDLENLVKLDYIEWDRFRDKTIFITGATGLIGFNLTSALVYADMKKNLGIKIIAYVRDFSAACEKYAGQLKDSGCLELMSGDILELPEIQTRIDYIIHLAGPTASNFFIEQPVETIKTMVVGTFNILELAKAKKAEKVIYASSMEVYGSPSTDDTLAEDDLGYLNPLLLRNCYPESKRQCESLCVAYADEYNIPVAIIRLAQTFGKGVAKNDNRVFAEFARCAAEGRDITLLTDGSSRRCYLYTMDAVSAILTLICKGEAGKAYNAANPDTYCSVREMAELVASTVGENKIRVKLSENSDNCKKFSPPHCYNLDISAISELGWQPMRGLEEIYQRMMENEESI